MSFIENSNASAMDKRRDQIITAATEQFLDCGFDRTSMVGIAQHAGVSKQTLYSHFGSKESLFREAITHACRKHTPQELLSQSDLALQPALIKLGTELCALLFSEDAIRLECLCIAGATVHTEVSTMFWQAGPAWVQSQLCSYFAQLISAGKLRDRDPELIAQQFLSLLCGETRMKVLMGISSITEIDVSSVVHDTVDVIVAAYGTEGDSSH